MAETRHRIAALIIHIADGGGSIQFELEAAPANDPDAIDASALHPDIRAALLRWLTSETEEKTP